MAAASVTHVFVNGTAADAIQMNTNFTDLVDFLNNETIHADGSKAFTDNVSQPTTPTDPDHLTRKGYVDDQAALLIPKSIVDAAGDLIVADAADSVVRLAKGSDGQILSTIAGSVVWGSAAVFPPVAFYSRDGAAQAISSNKFGHVITEHFSSPAVPTNVTGFIEFVGPFFVSGDVDIDGISAYVNSQSGNIRFALYEGHATTGAPDALIVESASAAQVNGANTHAVTQTTLEAGKLYWLAVQTSASSGNFYHSVSDGYTGAVVWNTSLYNSGEKYREAQAYGAFPATATPTLVAHSTAPAGVPLLSVQFV